MRTPLFLAAAALTAACNMSRPDTMKSLAEEQTISAAKDSLLQEVSRNAAFIRDLNQQLGAVRGLRVDRTATPRGDLENAMSPSDQRAHILTQVREVTERLNESERRVAESRRRITELTGSDASKSRRLAAFDSVATSLRTLIETQREQIAELTAQTQALQEQNDQLRSDNTRLASSATQLTAERDSVVAEQNTVYYVAGTPKELADQKVIERVGGFLGMGKTVVPSRRLDPSAFTPIDLRTVTDIPLPNPRAKYRIVTRQNVDALATPPDDKGRLSGMVSIRTPQSFWAGSRYLILVAQ
jgi:regulator of replication initiation timing